MGATWTQEKGPHAGNFEVKQRKPGHFYLQLLRSGKRSAIDVIYIRARTQNNAFWPGFCYLHITSSNCLRESVCCFAMRRSCWAY